MENCATQLMVVPFLELGLFGLRKHWCLLTIARSHRRDRLLNWVAHHLGFRFSRVRRFRDARLSPQTGAKPGATLGRWSARAAERFLRRVDQGAQGGVDGLLVGKILSDVR